MKIIRSDAASIACAIVILIGTIAARASVYPEVSASAQRPPDILDIADVMDIAQAEAARVWGEAQPGDPIPCVDVDGVLTYFMVPFRLGDEPFPDHDAIYDAREDSRRRIQDAIENFDPAYDDVSIPQSASICDPGESISSNDVARFAWIRPDGTVSHRMRHHERLQEMKSRIADLAEDTRYGTVIVSARERQLPVSGIYHFLPPLFINGVEARDKADFVLGATSCDLKNILYVHPGELYYRFSGNGREVLIHCKTLEAIEKPDAFIGDLKHRMETALSAMSDAERARSHDDIDRAWTEVWRRASDMKQEVE